MKSIGIKRYMRSVLRRYAVFFTLLAMVITCCFVLFIVILQKEIGFELTKENIQLAATVTFGNVMLLSLLCTLVDSLRRKITIERPIKHITEVTQRITQGDFSARIRPLHIPQSMNEFGTIIPHFNKMAQELSGIETLRTDFIANVSHELKTPLAVLQNYSTMLAAPALSDEKRLEYAKAMTETTQRLSDLITNILKLNKLENQQIYSEAKRYNLSEQLCECLLQFESRWEQKNLEIESDIDEDVFITSDKELLALVWNNLFSNAVKFTDSTGKITLRLKKQDQAIRVSVADTGRGMTAKTGQHIFDKFYQGDSSHATQGNGLGLALVKRVVDILRGEISVESELGAGTTFTVTLKDIS